MFFELLIHQATLLLTTFFIWLEQSPLSLWVRGESGATMAFPVIISFHAVGMGFLAGIACMINLRILGVASHVPLARLAAFLPIAWLALVMNASSGTLLLIGYPTKALTNPVFYIKMTCIAAALWCLFWIRRHALLTASPVPGKARGLAGLATVLWLVAIVTGRLLAYTHSRLMSA